MLHMENEALERAQIIIDMFRRRTIEIQEQLIAEQVAHEQTKRNLTIANEQLQVLRQSVETQGE